MSRLLKDKAQRSEAGAVASDPRPRLPERPGSDDCCRSGCCPCVFELYQDDLQQYREELAAWEQRQASAGARIKPK